MRLHYVDRKNGKKRVNWPALVAFVPGAYALVIGAAEVFWYGLTGGFSPLIGLFALVAATLVVIRVVGTSLSTPADLLKAQAGGV